MLRPAYLLPCLLLLGSLSVSAQGILPDRLGGWSASKRSAFSPGQPDASAIAMEYGFREGQECSYSRAGESLDVLLYRMKDPSGAYGEYSVLRTPDMPRADLTEHSSMSRERALILTGNLVLEIRGKDMPARKAELQELVAAIAPKTESGPLPTLWQHLPLEGFVERSDHYLLGPVALYDFLPIVPGDWLGFSEGAEAEQARYRRAGRELTLLIADFPTPQAAAKKLAELERKLDVNASGKAGGRPLFARRSLTLLAIVSGARTQAEANALLSQVHSGTELTWNEPSFSLTDPSIGAMIVGTIIGTGIICAFALISGLAFGGVRIVVKRSLPDKIFDRSSQLQILQLGLSSKPINAEDFYSLGSSRRG